MLAKIVTLTTDFGLADPYVAEMKGIVLGICPNATIVDVTHSVEKFNINMGAFMLASAAPYFPAGTIHVAVVDPGVGTQRQPIIVQTEKCVFVGPDNGLLMLAAEGQGIKHRYKIENQKFMLPHVSSTFHGRDIFTPVAAYVAKGVALEEFGPEISAVIQPTFTKATQNKGAFIGEVLHVDGFGNIITNIHAKDIESIKKENLQVELPNAKLQLKFVKAYGETKPHQPVALIGSHSYLEVALNQGSAAAKFQAKAGDKIVIAPA